MVGGGGGFAPVLSSQMEMLQRTQNDACMSVWHTFTPLWCSMYGLRGGGGGGCMSIQLQECSLKRGIDRRVSGLPKEFSKRQYKWDFNLSEPTRSMLMTKKATGRLKIKLEVW